MRKIPSSSQYDLRDLTFIIPVHLDSPIRLRNLQHNLHHLLTLFESKVLIGEQKPVDAPTLLSAFTAFVGKFEYFEMQAGTPDNPFHRTRLVNQLLARVQTPLVCNLDCDAVFALRQYLIAVQLLRWGAAEFVLPYDDRAVHIPEEKQLAVLETLAIRPLCEDEVSTFAEFVFRGYSVGGALFAVTTIYRQCGGENESFLGWGWEDHEHIVRFQKLGYRLRRVPGDFYHLSHPRTATSSDQHAHYDANWRELQRIIAMSSADLRSEVDSWYWLR